MVSADGEALPLHARADTGAARSPRRRSRADRSPSGAGFPRGLRALAQRGCARSSARSPTSCSSARPGRARWSRPSRTSARPVTGSPSSATGRSASGGSRSASSTTSRFRRFATSGARCPIPTRSAPPSGRAESTSCSASSRTRRPASSRTSVPSRRRWARRRSSSTPSRRSAPSRSRPTRGGSTSSSRARRRR